MFHELSFDQYHKDADRIYRVSSDITEPDDHFRWASTQFPLGKTLKTEFAEVEQYTRFISMGRRRLEKDNINYFEEKIYAVDSTVFDIFSFKFLMGDPQTALDAPRSIVLNKTLADRIFKGEDPMGKVLKSDDSLTLTVKGVYEDMPENSHLIAHAMISSSTNPAFQRNNNWGGFSIQTYVKLNPNVKPEDFEPKLEEINKKYVATIFDQFGIKIKYELWPITKIHLYSDFEGEPEPLGDIRYIYIFSIVGAFLLIIACINYMNLATSRSVSRALEVGVRKVMGAKKGELVGQFLAESMLLILFCITHQFDFIDCIGANI